MKSLFLSKSRRPSLNHTYLSPTRLLLSSSVLACGLAATQAQPKLVDVPWPSETPADCPIAKSETLVGIVFTDRHPRIDTVRPRWFYFASASRPFGMVNLRPETNTDADWNSGYRHGDDTVQCLITPKANSCYVMRNSRGRAL